MYEYYSDQVPCSQAAVVVVFTVVVSSFFTINLKATSEFWQTWSAEWEWVGSIEKKLFSATVERIAWKLLVGFVETNQNSGRAYFVKKKKVAIAQRGAGTHDPEIKSLMLYRLI